MNWNELKDKVANGEPFSLIPEGMELIPVAGVSFVTGYPDNLLSLRSSGNIPVDLIRNPDNLYDKNAVEVRLNGNMLGHLPRDIAARVAPIMDEGVRIPAMLFNIRVVQENPKNPGLDILIERV